MRIAHDTIIWKLAAAALSALAVIAVLRAIDAGGVSAPDLGADGAARTGEAPADPQGLAELGRERLQRLAATEDPALYPQAKEAFGEALRLDPRNFTAVAGLGELELSRHHFKQGLALSLEARRIDPSVARVDGQIVDGQIELGRYAAAERTLSRYIDRQPELASYARVSYFRELHGDLAGATNAMALGASAAGRGSAGGDFAQTLIGQLQLARGEYAAAERSFRGVLSHSPTYPDALLGLSAVEAARGDLESAIERRRGVLAAVEAPDHAILLGEAQEAAGDEEGAAASYAIAGAQFDRLERFGADTATERALFEVDHGSVEAGLAAGKGAWARTPTVRAADAYAWALSAAGEDRAAQRFSAEALRLGSRDPEVLYRAGIVAQRAGRAGRARALLTRALAQTPRFHPLHAPAARAALRELG